MHKHGEVAFVFDEEFINGHQKVDQFALAVTNGREKRKLIVDHRHDQIMIGEKASEAKAGVVIKLMLIAQRNIELVAATESDIGPLKNVSVCADNLVLQNFAFR